MDRYLLATLIENGTRILSDIISIRAIKPSVAYNKPQPSPELAAKVETAKQELARANTPSQLEPEKEKEYRHECVLKHLGGAAVLLREAYERANDEGMGQGTAEKVVEAMNEHSGAEVDLEKMLPYPETKELASKLLSGVRAFRKASWEAKLPTGGGTKQDVEDARLWNALLLKETMDGARKFPGTRCVAEGM